MNELDPRSTPVHQQLIASVLLAEIAGYEDRPVFEQIDLTSRCRQLIEHGIAATPCQGLVSIGGENHIVLLFPGDPADCLRFAQWLENILANDVRLNKLPMRVGINLGPVKVVRNERGEVSATGTGIDDALRVAQSGRLREVLISRAFYTVLSRASMNDRLLRHRSFISDEHDQSLAIYEIAHAQLPSQDSASMTAQVQQASASWHHSRARWSAVAAVALVAVGGMMVLNRQSTETIAETHIDISAAKATFAALPEPAPRAVIAVTEPERTMPTQTQSIAVAEVQTATPVTQAKRSAAPEAQVTVQLAIKPWGEVYVDGKKVGVTPPMHNIKLPPGKREILVRNSDFVPFQTTLDVQPESLLLVSHRFDK